MFVATDNLLADAAADAAAVEWLRKSFFGAKFVQDLFFGTFFFFISISLYQNFYRQLISTVAVDGEGKVNFGITFDDADYWIDHLIHRINISVILRMYRRSFVVCSICLSAMYICFLVRYVYNNNNNNIKTYYCVEKHDGKM